MSNIIKITKKEQPWEALQWTGNIEEIQQFISKPVYVRHRPHDQQSLWIYHLGEPFSLKHGEYLFKTPKGNVGKITQEIIDRSWNIITEDDWNSPENDHWDNYK